MESIFQHLKLIEETASYKTFYLVRSADKNDTLLSMLISKWSEYVLTIIPFHYSIILWPFFTWNISSMNAYSEFDADWDIIRIYWNLYETKTLTNRLEWNVTIWKASCQPFGVSNQHKMVIFIQWLNSGTFN